MHASIAELGRRLQAIKDNFPDRPTSQDRNKLLQIRSEIKQLGDEDLGERDDDDRAYLYVESTRLANLQEAFYEKNGNKWQPMTKEQLVSMGGDAPLGDELLQAFPIGNLHNFAEKELPAVRRALRVRTLGNLATRTRSEIAGPQARNAGNKTLEWIDAVCREFGIEPPKHGEAING
jgi:hypothetical protein